MESHSILKLQQTGSIGTSKSKAFVDDSQSSSP